MSMIQELMGQTFSPKDVYVRDITQPARTLVAGTITPVTANTKFGVWHKGKFTLPEANGQVFESWERKRKPISSAKNYELARFYAPEGRTFANGTSVAAGKVCWMLVEIA